MHDARPRSTALYCTVISRGPLIIVRMSETFVRWDETRKAIHDFMRERHGVAAKDIHVIEGLAGSPDGDADDGQGLALCERAFAGDASVFKDFALYAWDDAERSFRLVRSAAK